MLTKFQVSSASVIDMLREDHKKVKGLFEEFEQAADAKAKQRIVETALRELEVHNKLEEDLIYPAIRAEVDDDDLMDEALEEHHVVHALIGELKKMKPSDDRYDAKFTCWRRTSGITSRKKSRRCFRRPKTARSIGMRSVPK
jgi:hemerythrin superfamily protein